MITLVDKGAWLLPDGRLMEDDTAGEAALGGAGMEADRATGRRRTISYGILQSHNTSPSPDKLRIRFDALASHDITYVGIIQTARASGMTVFPVPYVLTTCHNTLCAVGGTINEDDHVFGLTAARKYGGIYVPPHLAVIHQYMREQMAACGSMILGSDSHTRYGALGTMAIGEGGGELAKQLLRQTWDADYPQVVAVELTGSPRRGVGPQDVALALIGAVFDNGFVKNKVMEFIGEGIASLDMDFRNGIDVMTTETTCLSSIWPADDAVKECLAVHGRPEAYKPLGAQAGAYYDSLIRVDLSKVEPMIALPMHPSNAYTIHELQANLEDILAKAEEDCQRLIDNPAVRFSLRDKIVGGHLYADQGVIAGCAGGTYTCVGEAARIIGGNSVGQGAYSLSVYPSSQPVMLALTDNGYLSSLMRAGAVIRSAFCGPCFGAGDVPANNGFSIRHTTRNFPSREGAKPGDGQIASVALMDARSIAATSLNQGKLTAATDVEYDGALAAYTYDNSPYASRVYQGFNRAMPEEALRLGPGITDWPDMPALPEHALVKLVSFITDPVTTTDELIPSGETSSYRSNPMGLAEFTLSRKDPAYVGKAKAVRALEESRQAAVGAAAAAPSGGATGSGAAAAAPSAAETAAADPELAPLLASLRKVPGFEGAGPGGFAISSAIYARKPGDGSAREQAASCQRVLGAGANIAAEYATKRYRSNLINWGMLPFLYEGEPPFGKDDVILFPRIREALKGDTSSIEGWLLGETPRKLDFSIAPLTGDEADILLAGCLINFNRRENV
ncbi:MAG: hydratase [Clostridiales bacterium]|nr:hydratase [Clostridiales bacterium]